MKLALQAMRPTTVFGLWSSSIEENVKAVQFAERLGYDSVWSAEAAGTDGFVPLAWLAAHTRRIKVGVGVVPISARPPVTTAMTAATLDRLSDGRVLLGLGVSGPAVVEGWHGMAFSDPLGRVKEYTGIVREVLARRNPRPIANHHYPLPYPEATEDHESTIRLMFRPVRSSIPVYLAAMGPRMVRLATKIADGAIPAFYSPFHESEFFESVGLDRLDDRFDLAPFVPISMADDAGSAWDSLKPIFAFLIGGMGSGTVNFYAQFAERIGFRQFPEKVKSLFRAGYRAEAASAIPDEFVDSVGLCGPRRRIEERLDAWKRSSVNTMIMTGLNKRSMVTMAELLL